jgi:sulfhydrogenase subunit alpha
MTALGFRGAAGTDFVRVEALTRVEGEGGVLVRIEDGQVAEVQLRIFEPPRFFEGLLRGRSYLDPVDITARICGICPVAYQMSAGAAIEDALGIPVRDGPIRDLRLLLYCGEWIESHALHVYLLHAPDFLGYEHGLAMAADHPDVVTRGLRLKKAGNTVMEAVGGRAVHPVNPRVGGFHRAPTPAEIAALRPVLEEALDDALATVRWVARLTLPAAEVQVPLVAVWHPTEYPMLGERLVSTHGYDLPVQAWGEWFHELQVPRSTALHAATKDGETYLTGPLARYTLSSGKLRPLAQEVAADAGLGGECRDPFRSIVVRAVEIVHAVDLALELVDRYTPPTPSFLPSADPARAVEGHGVSEAPRGALYHRYRIGPDGLVDEVQIVPPTAQNQAAIEADIRAVAQAALAEGLEHDQLQHRCETAVRNHDPCISCSTHFVTVEVTGGPRTPASPT